MCACRQRLTERFIACKVLKPLLGALTEIHSCNIVHRYSCVPLCAAVHRELAPMLLNLCWCECFHLIPVSKPSKAVPKRAVRFDLVSLVRWGCVWVSDQD